MTNSEIKINLVKAFTQRVKGLRSNDVILLSGQNIQVKDIVKVDATLQNAELTISDLMSKEGANFNFAGQIRFSTIQPDNCILEENYPFEAHNIRLTYDIDKSEFAINNDVSIILLRNI